MDYLLCILITGIGATAVMDLWGIARKQLLGIASPDYRLVGRWLSGLTRGHFRHHSIAKSPRVPGEHLIGWTAHYLIGVTFAAVLFVTRPSWIQHPTLTPALIVGIATVAAPFLVMQPGMGAGIAASRSPRPTAARLQSLITHAIFGFGLYGAGLAASLWYTR